MEAKVGDRIAVESEKVGKPEREGEVLEVLSAGASAHYRVRWADGRESIFMPSAGSLKVIAEGRKASGSSP